MDNGFTSMTLSSAVTSFAFAPLSTFSLFVEEVEMVSCHGSARVESCA